MIGIISSATPDLFKFLQDRQDKQHELEVMRLQIQQAKLTETQKLEAVQVNSEADMVKSAIDELKALQVASATPSGVRWVDAFGSLVRPLTAFMVMAMFAAISGFFVHDALSQLNAGRVDLMTFSDILDRSLMGQAIEAVLGFLFGARGYLRSKVT